MADLEQRVDRLEDNINRMWDVLDKMSSNGETLVRLETQMKQMSDTLKNLMDNGSGRCGVQEQRLSTLEKGFEALSSTVKSNATTTNIWKGALAMLVFIVPLALRYLF